MTEPNESKSWRRIPIVLAASLVAALSFGFHFGRGNQNSYLVHGLRVYDPSILAGDWLAAETDSYHPTFSYLAGFLFSFGESPWPFVLLNTALIVVGCLLIWMIIAATIEPSLRLATFLLTLGMIELTQTAGEMGSYLFSRLLQPSVLGGVGFLAAIWLFVTGRYLASGLMHAVTGLFHANYLVLGFPVFLFAHILLGRERLGRRVAMQLTPPTIALLPLLPLIAQASTSEAAAAAREILFHIRSPHHYIPWLGGFTGFVAWHLLAVGVALWRPEGPGGNRGLRAIIVSMFTGVMAATLLTTIVFVPAVSQAFVWRLAPISVLLAQVVIFEGVLAACCRSSARTALSAAAVGCGVVLLAHDFPKPIRMTLLVLMLSGACLGFARQQWSSFAALARIAPLTIAGLAWLVATAFAFDGVQFKIPERPAAEQGLYDWAKTTPAATAFLIPPDLDNFRFHARRAVVVDWKSPPLKADELLEWYRRLEDISGKPDLRGLPAAVKGYAAMDDARLKALSEAYDFDYVVLNKKSGTPALDLGEAAFENDRYQVFADEGRSQ